MEMIHEPLCKRGHSFDLVGRDAFNHCRACHKINSRNQYNKNIEASQTWARNKARTAKYKDTHRNWKLQKDFGITLEDYNKMFADQKGLCLGCYKHQSSFKKAMAVDHDHTTGKIRGLLCMKCNSVLGYVADDSTTLRRLADYADKHKETI